MNNAIPLYQHKPNNYDYGIQTFAQIRRAGLELQNLFFQFSVSHLQKISKRTISVCATQFFKICFRIRPTNSSKVKQNENSVCRCILFVFICQQFDYTPAIYYIFRNRRMRVRSNFNWISFVNSTI